MGIVPEPQKGSRRRPRSTPARRRRAQATVGFHRRPRVVEPLLPAAEGVPGELHAHQAALAAHVDADLAVEAGQVHGPPVALEQGGAGPPLHVDAGEGVLAATPGGDAEGGDAVLAEGGDAALAQLGVDVVEAGPGVGGQVEPVQGMQDVVHGAQGEGGRGDRVVDPRQQHEEVSAEAPGLELQADLRRRQAEGGQALAQLRGGEVLEAGVGGEQEGAALQAPLKGLVEAGLGGRQGRGLAGHGGAGGDPSQGTAAMRGTYISSAVIPAWLPRWKVLPRPSS